MEIQIGKKYLFNNDFSEYQRFTGTVVEVIRQLTDKECDIEEVGNMYEVRCEDGFVAHAFEYELEELKECTVKPRKTECESEVAAILKTL